MEQDLSNITQTSMKSSVTDYSVQSQTLDTAQVEQTYNNPDWTKYLGYYKTIPELKSAIDSFVMWIIGRGYTADTRTTIRLDNINGWGEDSFQSILQNVLIQKFVNGDGFAEIIRNESGTLINLKPIDPSNIKTVVNGKGVITGYKFGPEEKHLSPQQVLHLCNDRVGSEIHGVSKIEAVKWLIDYRNEMLTDLRRVMHRTTIRVMYIDADDTTRLSSIKTEYAAAIKNGELMIIPGRKGEAEFQDLTLPPVQAYLEAIRYTETAFYKAIGVPEVILGGTQSTTEAASKVGMFTFQQPYMTEQRLLEQDLWQQMAIKLTLTRPENLKDNVQEDEAKNTGQLNVQPNDTQIGVGRQ